MILHDEFINTKRARSKDFIKQYGVNRLVYAESYEDVRDAIQREKQLKKWNRAWKIQLVEGANPEWDDLEVN